jgi:hypothetical protein
LSTDSNRKRRTLVRDAMCQICGCGEETGFHATVCCTKAAALRTEMRRVWELPDEEQFSYTGSEWLLHLLGSVDDETKAQILLILWRAWHLGNDSIHAKGKCTTTESTGFRTSYALALHIANDKHGAPEDPKGKRRVNEGAAVKQKQAKGQLGHKKTQAT